MTTLGPTGTPLAAVARLATRYGLPADRLDVMKDGSNLLVHLAPAPVVLRVTTFTARIRGNPLPYLEREVALVSWLAAAGAPVMAPADVMPPGPHVVNGWAMAAWRFVAHEPGVVPSAAATLGALDELHAVMRGYPGELPLLGPATSDLDLALRFALAEQILGTAAVAELTTRRDALVDELLVMDGTRHAQHGDAFPRNTLVTSGGIVWIDFEDACLGSPLWDLATLVRSAPDDALRREIARRHGEDRLAIAIALRQVQVDVWQALHDARAARGW